MRPDEQSAGLYQIGYVSSRGGDQSTNEDFFRAYVPDERWWLTTKGAFFAVADGYGERPTGSTASRIAVDTTLQTYYRDPGQDAAGALERACIAAHQQVYAAGGRVRSNAFGATLIAVVILGNELIAAHVGDSRLYLAHEDRVWQITRDHTWVGEKLLFDDRTTSQVARRPWRHQLTRTLGGASPPHVDVARIGLVRGDAILLCTDGLSDYVWDHEIGEVLTGEAPVQAAKRLLDLATARGGHDDMTVVVVRFTGEQYDRHDRRTSMVSPVSATQQTGDLPIENTFFRLVAGFALAGFFVWLFIYTLSITPNGI